VTEHTYKCTYSYVGLSQKYKTLITVFATACHLQLSSATSQILEEIIWDLYYILKMVEIKV